MPRTSSAGGSTMSSVFRSLRSARHALLAALAAVALSAAAAAANPFPSAHRAATVDVARLLATRTASVRGHDGGVAVLLPQTMPLDTPDYTAAGADGRGYRLEIDGAEPCAGANVCLFALFTGHRGGRLSGTRVTLSHGVRGAYTDIQCGAACSPASIDWIERGVLYTIEANPAVEDHPGARPDAITSVFVAAADQAIDHGPR